MHKVYNSVKKMVVKRWSNWRPLWYIHFYSFSSLLFS